MASSTKRSASPPRLAFIDGLRGIAAFIVMTGHCLRMVNHTTPGTSFYMSRAVIWWYRLLSPLTLGTPMVALFIFVSGFGLYYSEARRRERQAPMTLRAYFERRAWRIFPVYYVALSVSVGVLWAFPATHGPLASLASPAPFSSASLAAHLCLLQNVNPLWAYQIDPPLWSIPVEVQLYFVFPLILWIMTQTSPLVGSLLVMTTCGAAAYAVDVTFVRYFYFFVGGMLSAYLAYTLPLRHAGFLGFVGLGALLWAMYRGPFAILWSLWFVAFVGLTLASYHLPEGPFNPPTWRPFRWLGQCSYSLYAIHFPVLLLIYAALHLTSLPGFTQEVILLFVGSALSLALARLLYSTVEIYSLNKIHGLSNGS